MNITFALPALLWPGTSTTLPPLQLAALDTLRRWGRFLPQPCTRSDFYARHLSHGAWLAEIKKQTGTSAEQACLLCSPVSQTVGMHQAPFISGPLLQLSLPAAQAYCQTLSDFFQAEHIGFTAFTPTLWLLQLPRPWSFTAPNLWDLHGSMDKDSKPQGQDAARVLQFVTECQMLLYQHPLNQWRQQQALPPINGIWLQNDITSQAPKKAHVFAQHDWALNTHPLPHDVHELLASTNSVNEAVLFLDDLVSCADSADAEIYATILTLWEQHWFAPVQQALQDQRIHTVNITTDGPHGGTLHIRKPWLTPFWRHPAAFNGQTL